MKNNPFLHSGQFFKGNLHTHSNVSDGTLSPEEVCRRYQENGYDFICLSDHFLPVYDFPVSDTRAFRTSNFTTILGAEVHLPSTLIGETSALRAARGNGWGLLDQLLSRGHHLNALATDDAHFQTDDAFGGWVMVKAQDRDPDALLAALKSGHYYSTQGPEIHDIRFEADEVIVGVMAMTYMDFILNTIFIN